MSRFRPGAFGWLRDLPDPRDYGPDHPSVLAAARELRPGGSPRAKKTDWSDYFPQVEDQLELNACVSCACVGLAGYFERRSTGMSDCASRLFLYQAARRLSGGLNDSGAELRTTLKALARFGLPPSATGPTIPLGCSRNPHHSCTDSVGTITR